MYRLWNGSGCWIHSSWRTMTRLSCIVNAMVVVGLATLGARASAAMALTVLTQNIPVPSQDGLNFNPIMYRCVFSVQVPISMPDKASYCKISQHLEAARFVFRIVRLLWYLTGTSTAMLSMRCLCRWNCQISKRCDRLNYQSREISRDLTMIRLIPGSFPTNISPLNTQIAKSLGSTLIRHRSNAKVSASFLIYADSRLFVIWVCIAFCISYGAKNISGDMKYACMSYHFSTTRLCTTR